MEMRCLFVLNFISLRLFCRHLYKADESLEVWAQYEEGDATILREAEATKVQRKKLYANKKRKAEAKISLE
jgi:hypothetical protein